MIDTPLDASIVDYALQSKGIDRATSSMENDEARETAKKFEALLLNTMLKNMRAATPGDGLLNSKQGELYLDMLDQQVSKDISESGSFGLAESIYRQLTGQSGVPGVKSSNTNIQTQHVSSGAMKLESFDQSAGNSPTEFVNRIRTVAEQTAHSLGTNADAVIAIAALETGWGKSVAIQSDGTSTHNLFGIKADPQWNGMASVARTHEYVDGESRAENAAFRVYANEAQSILDFGNFIKSNPRYKSALQSAGEPEAFLRELQDAGYATDPNYADKAISIMNNINTM